MDSPPSGRLSPPEPSAAGHAIVIGSSMAGMAAARVLVEHFERVTLIERDRLPDGPEFRKGVPQARHAHLLLLRGLQILEQLFPGLSQELQAAGAAQVNFGQEVKWFAFGRWRMTYPSKLVSLVCSRPLLEHAVYRRLAAHPKVRFLQETEVTGLVANPEGKAVTGVRFRSHAGSGGPEEQMAGELVVDASGRGSLAPAWLEALGYPAPQETTVNAFPGYASRIYQRPANFKESWKMMYVQPSPSGGTRGAIILPMEGERWHLTLVGMSADYPPTDEAGFMEFARSLPTPKLHEVLLTARPLGPIVGFRRAENRLRHYDRLPRFLEGFLVFGDAVYALNPVYGQGITVAALGAMTLDQCLRAHRRGTAGLASRFQRQQMTTVTTPWQMATAEDRRWPKATGGSPPNLIERLLQRYIDRLMFVVADHPDLLEAFFQVQHMLRPQTLLLRPDIVLKVLLARSSTTVPEELSQPEPAAGGVLPPTSP